MSERIAHVCVPPPEEIKRQTPSRVSSEPDPELQEGRHLFLHSSSAKNFIFPNFGVCARATLKKKKRCQNSGSPPSEIRKNLRQIVYFLEGHVIDSVVSDFFFFQVASFTIK